MKKYLISLLFILSIIALSFKVQGQVKEFNNNDEYGVGDANTKFVAKQNILGGRTDFDYLNLENHPDASGVPLGGIGVGNVNLSPSGRFNRIGINNIHQPVKRTEACFLALWSYDGTKTDAVRLVQDNKSQFGMNGMDKTWYKGLFPTAELRFNKTSTGITPRIIGYSGLIPHNIKDSSLPVVWIDVELVADKDVETSVAFSWEDFIGIVKDPKSIEGMDGQLLENQRNKLVNGEQWPYMEKAATFAAPYNYDKIKGFKQYSPQPIKPLKVTFQNYVDEVVVAVDKQSGQNVTVLSSYSPENGDSAWASFIKSGEFETTNKPAVLTKFKEKSHASILAVKTNLKKGVKKRFRFTLSWYCPELKIDKATAAKGSYWEACSDYNKYFHNYFNTLNDVVKYAIRNRDRIKEQSQEWHKPILNSTLPDWYKFKLINSGYVIYTNMILNKKGDVTVNEGAMGGFAGTMDQRISSHPFYQKFFTQLDRSEMNIFADAMNAEGYILHFIGHYYVGMGTIGGRVPTEKGHMVDNSSGWIIQLVKDYEQTGDIAYLKKHVKSVDKIMEYLHKCMPEGSEVPVGKTTYDDFEHPPLYSYYAGVWLTTLKAYQAIGEALGDQQKIQYARKQFDISRKEIIEKLWNGRFFAYGCESDGSNRLDSILFTGQLAGQFLSRYCGWGDIYPMDMVKASIISQFKISLSKTPDYYANKVWDLNLNRGIDKIGSQCWPFYLESYTALAGIQAGFYSDGMDIMKHIQLVHLRKGWSWTQNLWNPSDVTYMTAPVTWFSTDVIAGSGINIPKGELRLAPIINGNEKVVLPLFYPTFWATLTIEPSNKKIKLDIIKSFGEKSYNINKIVVEPSGKPSAQSIRIDIPSFSLRQNKSLDLSRYWKEIMAGEIESAVLQRADSVSFRYVK